MRKVPSPKPEPEPEPEPPTPTGEDPQFKFQGWSSTTPTLNLSSIASVQRITLEYEGEKRIPTLSGKRPLNLKYTVTDEQFVIDRTENGHTGEASAKCTLTLPATAEYRSGICTITITGVDESAIVDI